MFSLQQKDAEVLVATSSDGLCVDTTYETVHYKDELLFYIPNTFTPNGDQHNNTFLPVFTAGYDPNDFTLMIFNR